MALRRIIPLVVFLCIAGIIVAATFFVNVAVSNAPRGWRLEAIRLSPGFHVLDWQGLGQALGAEEFNPSRLLFQRESGLNWKVANGSRLQVLLRTSNGVLRSLSAVRLEDGDHLLSGPVAITVEITGTQLRLGAADGRSAIWADNKLEISDGLHLDQCSISQWNGWRSMFRVKFQTALRFLVGQSKSQHGVFSLGGGVNCPVRWKIDGLPPEAFRILTDPDGHPYVQLNERTVNGRLIRRDGTSIDLDQPWVSIGNGADRIVALSLGGMRYGIETDAYGGQLVLRPQGKRGLFPEIFADRPGCFFEWEAMEVSDWLGGGAGMRDLWHTHPDLILGVGAVAAIAGLLGLLSGLTTPRWVSGRGRQLVETVLFAAGVTLICGAMWIIHHHERIDLRISLAVTAAAWVWATLILSLNGRLDGARAFIWITTIIMASGGLITQLQLASLMPTELLMELPAKAARTLTIFSVVIAISARLQTGTVSAMTAKVLGMAATTTRRQRALVVAGRWGLPSAVLVLLIVEVARGAEAGLGLMQPSEFAKSVYIVALGWIGAWFLFYARINHESTPWFYVFLRMLAGGAALCLSVPFLFFMVDDNSPIFILLVVTLIWLLIVSVQVRSARQGRPAASVWMLIPTLLLMTAAIALTAVVGTALTRPAVIYELAGAKVQERLAIARSPLDHPAAYQAARSFFAISKAPDLADGESVFAANSREIQLVPEIENDMIVAFIVSKFGRWPVVMLAGVQLAWLLAFTLLIRRTLTASGPSEFRLAASFIGLSASGYVCAHLLHWLIGYSNAFSGLIMGQPFTYFAAGNSHLVAVALPALVLAVMRWKEGE